MRSLALVALLAVVIPVGPTPRQDWVQPDSWTAPVPPVAIADDLFYVGTEGLASFLLTGDDGHVLIDATLEENVPLVLDNVRALGFDPADVGIVLSSHAHFDHVGGLAAMREATGAEVVLSERDAELVAAGGRGDFAFGDTATYAPARADRTIAHLETVTLGSIVLTAHLTPGHTRGCTSWSGTAHIEGEPRSFLSVCSLSVLEEYRLVGDRPSYPGIAHDFCASARHLATLEPDVFLAPHGGFFRLGPKSEARSAGQVRAFVDPADHTAYLERAGAAIEAVLRAQGEPGGCDAVLSETGP